MENNELIQKVGFPVFLEKYDFCRNPFFIEIFSIIFDCFYSKSGFSNFATFL